MSQEELTKLMKKFIKFDSDHSGDINYNGTLSPPTFTTSEHLLMQFLSSEFREALGLPDSEYVERLFNLLDVDESGMEQYCVHHPISQSDHPSQARFHGRNTLVE